MATLKELTYRLWRLLDGGDISDDTRFSYKELKGYIGSGIGLALKQNAFEQRNASPDLLYGSGQYAKTTIRDVQYDEEGTAYIETKDKSVAFGGSRNFEVSSVNPLSRWAKTFVTIRKEELFLQKFQANIPNVIQVVVDGSKLYFRGNAVLSGDLEQVKLSQYYVIPDLEEDDSELDLPTEYENQIVDQAFQILMRERINEDRANDGVPANLNFMQQ